LLLEGPTLVGEKKNKPEIHQLGSSGQIHNTKTRGMRGRKEWPGKKTLKALALRFCEKPRGVKTKRETENEGKRTAGAGKGRGGRGGPETKPEGRDKEPKRRRRGLQGHIPTKLGENTAWNTRARTNVSDTK